MKTRNNNSQKKNTLLVDICPKERISLEYYHNVLRETLELQEKFSCFYLISDYQAVSKKNKLIAKSVYETATDIISTGVCPKKSNIAIQSLIPQHAELCLILKLLFPSIEKDDKSSNLSSHFFNQSLIKATNILLLRANIVSTENKEHLKLAKKIAKKFNEKQIFPTPFPLNRGKRYLFKKGNEIYLCDNEKDIRKKILQIKDNKSRKEIENNTLFCLHNNFNSDAKELNSLKKEYEKGRISTLDVKESLIKAINSFISPIREKREKLKNQPSLINDILYEGSRRQEKIAIETMKLVKESLNLN